MQRIVGASFVILILSAFGGLRANAQAGPSPTRVRPPLAAEPGGLRTLIPGEEFLPAALRAQQADDFDNPAYPFVEIGEAAWSKPEGPAGKSCKGCHGAGDKNALKRVAASYPKYAPDVKRVITLQTRINLCRSNNLKAPPLPDDSAPMTAMTAYLRWLARGSPLKVDVTGPSAGVFERGAKLYQTKAGLLQLSCVQCHTERFGKKFGADTLSQGHPLSYPAYLTREKRVISLHERFRMCNRLARAEGQPGNSPDYVALELYLNWRSKELPVTAPGVRP
ncbi:MAG: sulfur oxidation c-type cytochrome SoxA [Rhodomicrobium sp.]|nr:sulfur oxidation c-type cytochrome SoxA [Rhodomicrobium sp.]